jgi:high-affinity nickel-transport protein
LTAGRTRSGPLERWSGSSLRLRSIAVCGLVLLLNVAAWIGALAAFGSDSVLLGMALLVYGLGLRHALDADHIAAIDNVTRKLMHETKKPVGVGLFFALGHSLIVILVTLGVAFAASPLGGLQAYAGIGRTVGTILSSLFLIVIAALNGAILLSTWKAYRGLRHGARKSGGDAVAQPNGPLTRLFRPLFGLVSSSWQMMGLGVVFGLSFDTATEIAMFTISAGQAAKGLALGSILLFPLIFAAGMALVDTADSLMMVGAYNWGLENPARKLLYNMAITSISILVALVIGAIQFSSLLVGDDEASGPLAGAVRLFSANSWEIGMVIVVIFATAWTASRFAFRTQERTALVTSNGISLPAGGGSQ